MLTRLKVSGFKNLVDVDVYFGPFTCIAGANGVGKSNLFDAIQFLSALADKTLVEAAISVRSDGERTGDIRSLFHRVGSDYDDEMSFEVEMIVTPTGIDDLGQQAEASITFLRYSLTLAYRADDRHRSSGSLELVSENLSQINKSDAGKHILFPHSVKDWRNSVITGTGRRNAPFISTETEGDQTLIRLHQDGGSRGQPRSFLAASLPRTVLSAANAAESPTALVARREMQSWNLLQLEPSALRKPNAFTDPTILAADGSFLASTLYALAHMETANQDEAARHEDQVYSQVANNLANLIDDVYDVWVDRDDKRELLTLHITDRSGTTHAARSLSDGTLRFLALAVLDRDTTAQGLICMEEPENGIHPKRIPAILKILQDIATDTGYPVDEDNPLRQVIVNTHSAAVVQQVPDDSLLIAELRETVRQGQPFSSVQFHCLPDTWRAVKARVTTLTKGNLMVYLNPAQRHTHNDYTNGDHESTRVIDREDLQPFLPGFGETSE